MEVIRFIEVRIDVIKVEVLWRRGGEGVISLHANAIVSMEFIMSSIVLGCRLTIVGGASWVWVGRAERWDDGRAQTSHNDCVRIRFGDERDREVVDKAYREFPLRTPFHTSVSMSC